MRFWIQLIFISLLSTTAHAFDAYKCKDEDGNIVFSQTRCVGTRSEYVNIQPATGEDDPYRRSRSLTDRAYKSGKSSSKNKKNYTDTRTTSTYRPKPSPGNSSECKYSKQRVASIQSQMRGGYSSQNGERLRADLRAARSSVKKNCN